MRAIGREREIHAVGVSLVSVGVHRHEVDYVCRQIFDENLLVSVGAGDEVGGGGFENNFCAIGREHQNLAGIAGGRAVIVSLDAVYICGYN